jgi:hypothetical protein
MKRNLKRSVSTFTTSFKSLVRLLGFLPVVFAEEIKNSSVCIRMFKACMLLWGFDYLNEMFLWWVTVMVAVISICTQNKSCVWLFRAQHLTGALSSLEELIAQQACCDVTYFLTGPFHSLYHLFSIDSLRLTCGTLHPWNSMHLHFSFLGAENKGTLTRVPSSNCKDFHPFFINPEIHKGS